MIKQPDRVFVKVHFEHYKPVYFDKLTFYTQKSLFVFIKKKQNAMLKKFSWRKKGHWTCFKILNFIAAAIPVIILTKYWKKTRVLLLLFIVLLY